MINPKERFQKSPYAKQFSDLTASEAFHQACEASLIQMSLNMARGNNLSEAWDHHSRLQGAKEFLEILLTLSDPVTEHARLPSKSLKPEVPLFKKLNPEKERP